MKYTLALLCRQILRALQMDTYKVNAAVCKVVVRKGARDLIAPINFEENPIQLLIMMCKK